MIHKNYRRFLVLALTVMFAQDMQYPLPESLCPSYSSAAFVVPLLTALNGTYCRFSPVNSPYPF